MMVLLILRIVTFVVSGQLKPIHIPAGIARLNRALLAPFAEGAGNIMGMLWAVGSHDSAYDTSDAYRILDEPMTTMREFLAEKAALVTELSIAATLAVCRRDKLFHNKNSQVTADRARI